MNKITAVLLFAIIISTVAYGVTAIYFNSVAEVRAAVGGPQLNTEPYVQVIGNPWFTQDYNTGKEFDNRILWYDFNYVIVDDFNTLNGTITEDELRRTMSWTDPDGWGFEVKQFDQKVWEEGLDNAIDFKLAEMKKFLVMNKIQKPAEIRVNNLDGVKGDEFDLSTGKVVKK